jgi:hypothetical protein
MCNTPLNVHTTLPGRGFMHTFGISGYFYPKIASKKGNTPLFVHTRSLRGGFMHIRRGVVILVLRCLLGFDFEPKMRLTLDDSEAKPLLFP